MMQELVTLCMSDIVRLLGTLGLLSLGIILTLWGLKRRRSGAVAIALFLCLAALVPAALAIEIPPERSVAQIQTNGPNSPSFWGDWYTSRGPGYHSFNIYIPCTFPSGRAITVELFDPESYAPTVPPTPPELDEIEPRAAPVPDTTTFTLTNPSGVVIATTTYTPTGGTSGNWATFATFFLDATNGCGIYRLTTTTSDDDQQGWKLQVTPDDPDGRPNTGDEISLGNLQTSFQHTESGCQTFHLFVPVTPSIRLSNFDMDVPWFATVVYTTPSGASWPDSTASGNDQWNNGGGTGYPPPGGDVIPNPEPGWWQAALCVDVLNQYAFDTGGLPYFYEKPPTPDMSVSKDDGTTTFSPDGVLTYTITYVNNGPGAALNAVLTDTLPDYTTFIACSGGLSCGEIPPPGSGVVTFSLGTVIAGGSGSVTLTVHVDPSAPPGTITNTVELDYSDVVFSDYPVKTATDVDQYEQPPPNPGIEIAKTVYLGHDSGAECPGGEIVTGTNGADVTYCFEVTNTGDTYLDSIVITDADLGIDQDDMTLLSGSTRLAPGASLVYYYETTINGHLVNTAETEGTPTDGQGRPLGLDNPTADDTAEVDEEVAPGIEIVKTVYLGHDSGAGCPGSEIVTGTNGADVTYCFEVTNTGDTYLDSIVITDADLGIDQDDMTLLSGSTRLAPGASLVYYYETTINGHLVNTAETEGTPTDGQGRPLGLDNPTADDDVTVDLIGAADPEITKSGDSTVASPGEIVTFTLQVTNGGVADALDVVVTDVIPEYLIIRSVTPTKGTVQQPIVNNTVIVDIGTLAGNNSEVVVITIVTEVKAGTPPGTVMKNQASLTFSEGDRQSNIVYVQVPKKEAPRPKPSEPEEPAPPPPAPPPATPAPSVEVLTVERLPETGGFPGWFTVVLGVPIIIGTAGLLNLALLGMRARRRGGRGD